MRIKIGGIFTMADKQKALDTALAQIENNMARARSCAWGKTTA